MGSLAPAQLTSDEEDAPERALETSRWAIAHVHQVRHMAAGLVCPRRRAHGLGDAEERLLPACALLHDVGYPAAPPDRHKASARVIRSHLGAPFDDRQVELIALLARYHRRAPPKLKHRRY